MGFLSVSQLEKKKKPINQLLLDECMYKVKGS